jgi:hypothetical protein
MDWQLSRARVLNNSTFVDSFNTFLGLVLGRFPSPKRRNHCNFWVFTPSFRCYGHWHPICI